MSLTINGYRAIHPVGEVVVVLPVVRGQVLMQLRDEKHGIPYPGMWGLFGGTIDPGETPLEAAMREVAEEIGWAPRTLRVLGKQNVEDIPGLVSYGFACPLDVPLEALRLMEGRDMALLSLADIRRRRARSPRHGGDHDLIPTLYIERMVEAAISERRL